jgi:hypothetical protein
VVTIGTFVIGRTKASRKYDNNKHPEFQLDKEAVILTD